MELCFDTLKTEIIFESFLSQYSHEDVPWISAEDGKPIEYEAVFYRTPKTSVRNYDDDS